MSRRARSILVHPYRGCKHHIPSKEVGARDTTERAALGDSGRTVWGNPFLQKGSAEEKGIGRKETGLMDRLEVIQPSESPS